MKITNIKFQPSILIGFTMLTIVLFTSCLGVKSNIGNSGKKLVETFYVGSEGTQYFIKPLTFNDDNKNQLILDVTFRYKDKIKDSASVNISLINTEIYRSIDSLKISNDSVTVVFDNLQFLFAERAAKKMNSRFSTKCELVDIYNLFDKNNWKMIVYQQKNSTIYYSPNDTKNKINKLKYGIFMLF